MQITITVPLLECAKCKTKAPIQPSLLYFKGKVPVAFQPALRELVREKSDVVATDSDGRVWEVWADDKPAGWIATPHVGHLCHDCGALWLAAERAFLSGARSVLASEPAPRALAVPSHAAEPPKPKKSTFFVEPAPNVKPMVKRAPAPTTAPVAGPPPRRGLRVAPAPAPAKKPIVPPPTFSAPHYGSSVAMPTKMEPLKRAQAPVWQPPKPPQHAPGPVGTVKTNFGSSAPVAYVPPVGVKAKAPVVLPKAVPVGAPTHVFPKTNPGSTVPAPATVNGHR